MEQVSAEQRRGLIESLPEELSIRRFCQLLGVNRSTLYYEEEPSNIHDVDVLNIIREVWEKHPYYGYRRIRKELRETYRLDVNRKRVYRLWFYLSGCVD
jgi:putative transposase